MSSTNIFMVPMGPKFDFNTSCRPSPALILTLRASPLLYSRLAPFSVDFWLQEHTLDSALGFRSCAADISRGHDTLSGEYGKSEAQMLLLKLALKIRDGHLINSNASQMELVSIRTDVLFSVILPDWPACLRCYSQCCMFNDMCL